MAMVVGQAKTIPYTGMSGAIATAWLADPNSGLASPLNAAASALCEAIATAVINHIQNNATITIGNTVGSLQTYTAGGVTGATAAPSSPQTIPAGAIQ